MLVDSHAHLDFPEFADEIDVVIKKARDAGVGKIINIGADLGLSEKAIQIAEKNDNVWATVGIHAEYADDYHSSGLKDSIIKLVESSDRIVAIGECGPDYNWRNDNKKSQLELFELQVDIAQQFNLPLVVHIRNGEDEKAAEDAYRILKKTAGTKGVIHCFTLDKKWVGRFIDLGLYLGYTGIITYKNADIVRESALITPLDRLLIETDAPYLAPQSVRGKRNEPANLPEIAEKMAEIKSVSYGEIEKATSKNAEKLFLSDI